MMKVIAPPNVRTFSGEWNNRTTCREIALKTAPMIKVLSLRMARRHLRLSSTPSTNTALATTLETGLFHVSSVSL